VILHLFFKTCFCVGLIDVKGAARPQKLDAQIIVKIAIYLHHKMKITMIGRALAYYHNCYNTFELRSSKNEVTKDRRYFYKQFFLRKIT